MGALKIDTNGEASWQSECILGLFKKYESDYTYAMENLPLGIDIRITPFHNCREQGYTIKFNDKEISFAENRNSDDIVVYPFEWNNDDETQRDINYENKSKYFKYQQFSEAWHFINEHLGFDATFSKLEVE